MGNFEFLLANKDYQSFAQASIDAERALGLSTSLSAVSARKALELAVKWMYQIDRDLRLPYKDNLSTLINTPDFKDIVGHTLHQQVVFIQKLGNVGAHDSKVVKEEDAILALRNLFQFTNFIAYCYSDTDAERVFDERLLPVSVVLTTRESALATAQLAAGSSEQQPLHLLRDAMPEAVLNQFADKRRSAPDRQERPFKWDELSEQQTRERLIDVDLQLAGWTLGQNCRAEVPVFGLQNKSGQGAVDYVLYGRNELPLAVVEAKKVSSSGKVGRQQAKEYADALEEATGQRPLIFYTNGFELWFVEDGYPERRVSGFYTQDELQLMVDRRTQRQPLTGIANLIKDDISGRYYQKEAIVRTCEAFSNRQRQALLVMATGSGKTRTAVSLVDVLAQKNWVKHVLFLADRTSLVKQAHRAFKKLLPDLSLCNLLESPEEAATSRMVFSTYPTMMNAIDGEKTAEGQKRFTVGHFDLIIIDESHRSIYQNYRAIFDYFDAKIIGLTATPREDIDKNTYDFFRLENGVPTYAYDLRQAVEDGYLVSYQSIETQLKLLTDGLHYDDLSQDEKDYFDEQFEDDLETKDIDSNTFNTWVFNQSTVEIVLDELMAKGIRTASGDELGKTIIFAKNHHHAEYIKTIFHQRYPEKGNDYVTVIDYSIKHSQQLIDDFSAKDKLPQIAISVDMLDTGIDVPEVVNLVFFKKVRSKIKFWQMIGRGTRLCPDLFGPDKDKDSFLIFDYGANFEYFRADPQTGGGSLTKPLTQRLYDLRVDLIRELQDTQFQDEQHQAFRETLIEQIIVKLQELNEEDFRVRLALKEVLTYRERPSWDNLTVVGTRTIKERLTPLILPDGDDELAKRFDLWMYCIELAQLTKGDARRYMKQVIKTAQALANLSRIPDVAAQLPLIRQLQENEFWQAINLPALEKVREALRDLLQFIDRESKKVYYTNFDDEIVSLVTEAPILLDVNDLRNYREKVEFYLKAHLDQPAVRKLHHNEALSEDDLRSLEEILWHRLGSKEDYERYYASKSITRLVREIVGVDREVANAVFSAFLSDEGLNANQIAFVKLVVDYIVKNGWLDKVKLQEPPFKSFGSLIHLFEYQKPVLQGLIQTIDGINERANQAS